MLDTVKNKLKKFLRFSKQRKQNGFLLLDFEKFQSLDFDKRIPISKDDLFPCLNDKTSTTYFEPHYTYHPAWAARVIREISPDKHIDISSSLQFCTMLSAFVKTEFYDFRPAVIELDNLESKKGNLMALDFETGSVFSISCMHTIEHIGLGRYGDEIDPSGDLKAIKELCRVCAPKGHLIVAVPVGKERIEFNAHRIYNALKFSKYFNGFTLKEFSLISDNGAFLRNADISDADHQRYGCGCFWFVKE